MVKNLNKQAKDLSIVKAIYKNLRSSPRKVNEILRSIRGKKADIALRDLQFSEKRVSKEISKTLKSAVSNAENNNQLDIDNLIVKEAYVGKGMVMKRYRPRARGRAGEIKKPFTNLTIIVSEKKQTTNKEVS
jgi:large subunit ribosomal protein L22